MFPLTLLSSRLHTSISTPPQGPNSRFSSMLSHIKTSMYYVCSTQEYGTPKTSFGIKQRAEHVSDPEAPSTSRRLNLFVANHLQHGTRSIRQRSGDSSSSKVQESLVRSVFVRTPPDAGQLRHSTALLVPRTSTSSQSTAPTPPLQRHVLTAPCTRRYNVTWTAQASHMLPRIRTFTLTSLTTSRSITALMEVLLSSGETGMRQPLSRTLIKDQTPL